MIVTDSAWFNCITTKAYYIKRHIQMHSSTQWLRFTFSCWVDSLPRSCPNSRILTSYQSAMLIMSNWTPLTIVRTWHSLCESAGGSNWTHVLCRCPKWWKLSFFDRRRSTNSLLRVFTDVWRQGPWSRKSFWRKRWMVWGRVSADFFWEDHSAGRRCRYM